MVKKRFYRNDKERIIGGVCAGLADYFDIDPVLVRVIAVVLFFISGFELLVYLLLWIIVPLKQEKAKKQKKASKKKKK